MTGTFKITLSDDACADKSTSSESVDPLHFRVESADNQRTGTAGVPCVQCGDRTRPAVFSAAKGGLVCNECDGEVRDGMFLDGSTLYTMQYN